MENVELEIAELEDLTIPQKEEELSDGRITLAKNALDLAKVSSSLCLPLIIYTHLTTAQRPCSCKREW